MEFKLTYRLLISICLSLALGFTLFYFGKSQPPENFEKKYKISSVDKPTYYKEGKPSAEYNELKWLTEKRLSNYEANIKALHNTILNMVIVIVLGILLIFYRPKGINVSFLSIQIPETILYLVVVLGALFLWLNLGLSLNSAVDSRLSLYYQFDSLTQELTSISYENELNHVLTDYSIVDNWCGFYFDIFESNGKSLKVLSALGLYGIFGLLISLLFTVVFVTSIELGYREGKLEGLSVFLILLSIVLILSSTFSWAWKHNYSTFYLAFIWISTAFFIYFWKRYRRSLQKIEEYQTQD